MTKKESDPDNICTHAFEDPATEDQMHRVSNLRDGEDWHNRSLRSVWVCHRRACILDAMAWVERAEDGNAVIYDTNKNEVHL